MRSRRTIIPWSQAASVTTRAIVDLREHTAMKARIGLENRLRSIEQETDNPGNSDQIDQLNLLLGVVEALEKETDRAMVAMVSGHPMFEQLTAIRGVGPTLAAKLIAHIDITRVDKVSALWKWAGLSVNEGKAVRPTKGENLHVPLRRCPDQSQRPLPARLL